MTLSNRSLKGRNGNFVSMKEITIHDRIERFLSRKFRASRSHATKSTYKGTINRFGDFAYQDYNQDLNTLIDNMLNKILDPIEVLNDFYTYLTQAENPQSKRIGYSNNSIRQYVTTVKEFLNDCGCRIYNEDIRRSFKLPRKVTTITEGLTKEVVAQIVRLANYKLATAVLIACSSGMRIGEIMKQLNEMGYVTREKEGKEYHYFPTSKKFESIQFNEIVFTESELESWLEAQGLKQPQELGMK